MASDPATGAAPVDPSRRSSGGLFRSIRAAFSNWWAMLGLLGASVSGFNLIRNSLRIELAAVVAEIARAYEALVHAPIAWALNRLHLPIPPHWAIDGAVIWLIVGGVVLRSAWVTRARRLEHESPLLTRPWDMLLSKRSLLPLFVAFCVLLWPIPSILLVLNPHVHRDPLGYIFEFDHRRTMLGRKGLRELEYLYDMRIVLLTQAALAALIIASWFALNALLKLYGQ